MARSPDYQRDGITLYCGDNCEVMLEMPPASVDLVVTSPPYDSLREYGGHSWDFYGVAWNLKRLLKPGGVIVWVVADATVEGSETGSSMKQALHFKQIGLRLHDTMIWHRESLPLNHNRYEQISEFMFVLSNGKPAAFNGIRKPCEQAGRQACHSSTSRQGGDGLRGLNTIADIKQDKLLGNIWARDTGFMRATKDAAAFDHPAIFPEALARDHIISWSNEGDTVLDPFSGSGTTIKMARELSRKGIGIEVNPEYCEIAKTRLEQRLLFQ